MAYRNQQQFIDELEKAGELVRIKSYVDPHLEIAEITDRISNPPPAAAAAEHPAPYSDKDSFRTLNKNPRHPEIK